MKAFLFAILISYSTLLALPTYAESFHFKTERLTHASKVTINDKVLIVIHPECAEIASGVHFNLKQEKDKNLITLKCAETSYQFTEPELMKKAAHGLLNLSDL